MKDLVALLRGRRIAVLTGAGCSTESGIPDYRGEGTRARARNPIQHREFLGSDAVRRRYWARSLVGWERFREARPNAAHRALAALEARGHLSGLVTQNVDRLHQAAGSQRVVELHGALAVVRCLGCGAKEARDALQTRLRALNPQFRPELVPFAPDGDAEVEGAQLRDFQLADCTQCGGVLKPDVVFFGDNVPRPTVDAAFELVDGGEVLFVVGSSLAVFSGFRFVRHAVARGVPVAVLNVGETRADPLAAVKVERRAGEALTELVEALA